MSVYAVVHGEGHSDITYHTHLFKAVEELGAKQGEYMIGVRSFQPFVKMLELVKNGKYSTKGKMLTVDAIDVLFESE